MTLAEIKDWLPSVILVLQLISGVGLWVLSQKFISKRQCKQNRESVNNQLAINKTGHMAESAKHEQRIKDVESDVAKLPDKTDVKDLSNKIEILTGNLGTFSGRLEGINRAVDLLNEHHINGGK